VVLKSQKAHFAQAKFYSPNVFKASLDLRNSLKHKESYFISQTISNGNI